MRHGKRYRQLSETLSRKDPLSLTESISTVRKMATCKYDETIEVSVRLGVDPRKSDQMVRGTVRLPHGTGRSVRVLAFCRADKENEAQEAGADYVGSTEFLEKIKGGWLEFDAVVATPDMMSEVGKLGKILGPKGLMPNPKSGTVTMDLTRAITEIKAGRVEFRVDKTGNIHVPIGKASFGEEKLVENSLELFREILRAKPLAAKGQYLRSIHISSSMSPSIKIDVLDVVNTLR
jgi:large subunit ribosomal protein L1